GRGGSLQLLRVSLSPGCRSHPVGVVRRVSQSATAQAAFAFPVAGSASGASTVGATCAFACATAWRLAPIPQMRLSSGFRRLVSRPPALRAPGLWLFPWEVSLLLNTPAFAGHTTGQDPFGVIRLSRSPRRHASVRIVVRSDDFSKSTHSDVGQTPCGPSPCPPHYSKTLRVLFPLRHPIPHGT